MINICLIGAKNSGKSTFLSQIKGISENNPRNIPKISFFKKVFIQGSKNKVIQYWDISGDSNYLKISQSFLKMANIILFFVSKDNKMEEVYYWVQKICKLNIKTYFLIQNEKIIRFNEKISRFIEAKNWKIVKCDVKKVSDCFKIQEMILKVIEFIPVYNNSQNKNELVKTMGSALLLAAQLGILWVLNKKILRNMIQL